MRQIDWCSPQRSVRNVINVRNLRVELQHCNSVFIYLYTYIRFSLMYLHVAVIVRITEREKKNVLEVCQFNHNIVIKLILLNTNFRYDC